MNGYRFSLGLSFSAFFLFFPVFSIAADSIDIYELKNKLLSSKKTEVIEAVKSLIVNGNQQASDILSAHLSVEKDDYIKVQIIEALPSIQSTTSRDAVLAAINDKNPYVRQSAVTSLAGFGYNETAAKAIFGVIEKDVDKSVKMSAVNTLSQFHDKRAVADLGRALTNEKDAVLRKSLVRALARSNSNEAKAELIKYSNDKDLEIRKEVEKVLGKRTQPVIKRTQSNKSTGQGKTKR